MMTTQNISDMLDLLTANYGAKFLDGADRKQVIKTWAVMFRDDDPELVMQAVLNCINTMRFKPTIADIRQRMSQAQMAGQMTEIEAFQKISEAVNEARSRNEATDAFVKLPAILRKVVGHPSQLISWRNVSEEQFQTVIMSQIVRSYRELAQREADYYALPKQIQPKEQWRVEVPSLEGLPEPEKPKTVSQILDDIDREAEAFRRSRGMVEPENYDRVYEFMNPTADEMKYLKAKFEDEK